MAAKQVKKMNVALDMDIMPWLNYEAARRDTSVTGLINLLAYESRDNAPEAVRENFKQFMETREK
ncbi:MAG: hypothetical protein IKF78_10010 [Atopobiaceae bacterium]|nr:hypothetical protein [Atopobiaceae bacterium]